MNRQNDATCRACGCQLDTLHRRGSSQSSQVCPVCGCDAETPRKTAPAPVQKGRRKRIAALRQHSATDQPVVRGPARPQPGSAKEEHDRRDGAARRPYGHRDAVHFREILLAMRNETLTDLRDYEEAAANITDNQSPDTYDDDVAVQLNASFAASSLEELAGLSARQRKLLEHIDAALERIETGKYGLCRSCRRRIPRERLDAVPHATLCLLCKTGRAA